MNQRVHSNLILITAIIYLFFNSVLLPQGLYFTTLLTPFFFIHLIKVRGLKYYLYFFIVTLLFACIQLPTVEHLRDYVISFVLLQTVAVFSISVYYLLTENIGLEKIFKSLASVNIALIAVAIIVLAIPSIRSLMWYLKPISPNVPIIPRLKMFTVEASYYSLIIMPLAGYYFLKKILLIGKHYLLFISLCVSLLLSFSLGALCTMFISISVVLLLNRNELRHKINFNLLAGGAMLFIIGMAILFFFYPHNPLFERIQNIRTGQDTSARGRTYEAFYIAWNVAKMKSIFFGCGLGQFKYIGRNFVDYYYSYSIIPNVVRIPNAVAETLSIYGIAGIVIRFSLIIFLFIKTKVWQNYYRQCLFVFIFIYQFTGSYLFNPAEYIMWILAFSPSLFPQFKKEKFNYKLVIA
ncbi:hypothetical protein A9P82_03450 [Arachidicoccus ginsenosidimutans]|uniref:O-antigen ligase family protein n=1 Tax=Arachidicoccus sp. BS20 TaxID=1850526 RepID=UPI0007F081D1|nr:O-antigen ligase family protein [Arachidicoccus sp. BS20]ANI88440.1 hypothetical protein A9P82_03450 [Arachidicoccus sp. BS20]